VKKPNGESFTLDGEGQREMLEVIDEETDLSIPEISSGHNACPYLASSP
jgi:aminopeptidase-like protein